MKSIYKRRIIPLLVSVLLVALCGCGGGGTPSAAEPGEQAENPQSESAQPMEEVEWPTKTVTIYNSSTAGSPTDIMAREVARVLEETTGVTVNVVNKTGGSGGVMFAAIINDANDGTILGSVTASQIASLQAGLDQDFPLDSFEFVANVQVEPYALAVSADSPYQSIEELLEYAQNNPGNLQVGGQGTGSALHLCILKLARDADFTFTWLPYEGGSESVQNLLGGHCQAVMTAPATVQQYVEAGQVKILAITGGDKLPSQPEVPTFNEIGYDIPLTQYRGFFVKAGIDPALKQAISDTIRQVTLHESFVDFMARSDMTDGYMDTEAFTRFVLDDYEAVGVLSRELLQ